MLWFVSLEDCPYSIYFMLVRSLGLERGEYKDFFGGPGRLCEWSLELGRGGGGSRWSIVSPGINNLCW